MIIQNNIRAGRVNLVDEKLPRKVFVEIVLPTVVANKFLFKTF